MKTKLLKKSFVLLACGISYLAFSSYSAGITGQSVSGCSCHGSNSSNTTLGISGIPTSGWLPSTAYSVTVSVSNPSMSGAGFDLASNVGTISGAPTNTFITSGSEIGHSAPKTMTAGSASWTFTWTSPASTATALVINFAGNAVNLNSQNTGDVPNQTTQTFNAALAPTATASAATSIGTTSATMNGSVNANGTNLTTISFEYGTTISYGSTLAATPGTTTGTSATSVLGNLTGLTASTLYHYRVKAVSAVATKYSTDMTFTTNAATGTAPSATVLSASTIANTSAKLNGNVNANGASTVVTFEYGPTITYGTSVAATPSPITGTTSTAVSATISGLTKNTKYHYRVKAVNATGTTYSVDSSFITTHLAVADFNNAGFQLFPNPAANYLILDASQHANALSIHVLDVLGRIMPLTIQKSGNLYRIELHGFVTGNYWLKIQDDQGAYVAPFTKL